jgi:site-specific DNA recombinase
MKRAVLYARVSTNEQTDNTSLDGQITKAKAHATRRGYRVADEIREVHSGADPDRPGLHRIRDLARSGSIDVVVFYAFDRFMRDETEAVIVEAELAKAGVTLEFMDLPDQTNEAYRIAKSLYRTFADIERRKITKRLEGGKQDTVSTGNVTTAGRAPFGYCEVESNGQRVFEILEDEAAVVRDMFAWYVIGDGSDGPMSIRGIAMKLTAMQIPTYTDRREIDGMGAIAKRRNGYGKWTPGTVSGMLANETYAGTWHYGKRNIAVSVPAIIDADTWQAAQERKSHNQRFSKRNTKYDYLLLHRLRCGHCGNKLTHYTTKGNGYYACNSHNMLTECDLTGVFRSDRIDAACWGWIRDLLGDPERLREGLQEYQQKQREITAPQRRQRDLLSAAITKLETRRERLLDLYLDGDYSREELDQRRNEIDGNLSELNQRLARTEAIIAEHELTQERLASLAAWAEGIAPGIAAAETSFTKRQWVIGTLDVTGELSNENGEKVARFHCVLGESGPVFASASATTATNPTTWRSPARGTGATSTTCMRPCLG